MAKGLLYSITYFYMLIFLSLSLPTLSKTNIKDLPGFPGPLPFQLETGYVSVGDLKEDQLFYYFVESERNPKEDPLILWLTGGPGCSAFSAVAYEIGPLDFKMVEYNGSLPQLVLNPYSWTKVSNIIFVDQPSGSGFSYTNGSEDYRTNDHKSAKEAHEFLIKWLIDHPQFLSNPLYIGGSSYAGVILPVVVQEISNDIEARQEPILNLKGYILGNPSTDRKFDTGSFVPHAHGMGLISDELYESAKKNCKGNYYEERNIQCSMDLDSVNELLSGLNKASILEPKCVFVSPKPKPGQRRSLHNNSTNFQLPYVLPAFGCRTYRYLLSHYWANDDSVRNALQVRKGTVGVWERCSSIISYVKDIPSTIHYHLNITSRGYRALIYSGDHDFEVPFVGTLAWIRSLNFPIVDDWRSWSVDGQVAGYTRSYANNLTFVTVKGAGHTAPEYNPKECSAMLQRWISHNRM
ncbi:serine carboxypeptidase-like 7 [Tasmannia lanceolata]|uniref:serine carboxypeptidase-like 7 n=1 Tax=Tasmannia lanceolata TaxID=3420 RepID=UPI00406438EF